MLRLRLTRCVREECERTHSWPGCIGANHVRRSATGSTGRAKGVRVSASEPPARGPRDSCRSDGMVHVPAGNRSDERNFAATRPISSRSRSTGVTSRRSWPRMARSRAATTRWSGARWSRSWDCRPGRAGTAGHVLSDGTPTCPRRGEPPGFRARQQRHDLAAGDGPGKVEIRGPLRLGQGRATRLQRDSQTRPPQAPPGSGRRPRRLLPGSANGPGTAPRPASRKSGASSTSSFPTSP